MHSFRRLITAIFLTVLSIILLFSAAFAYLIVTPWGGKLLVRYFKKEVFSEGLMHVGHYEGSLQEGFILKDIQITGLSYFPDALLRIQEIRVRLPLWDLPGSDFSIFNARIFIPDCDPIVFTGTVRAGEIKGNLYAQSVDVHIFCRFWALEDIRKNLRGFISNVDVDVKGRLSSPTFRGLFVADNLRYNGILLTDGFSHLNATFESPLRQFQLKGEIVVDSGSVIVRKTNLVLSPSKFVFRGDILNPMMDIHLGGKVEDMAIHLAIKGPFITPQLTVSSDPPMPPQEALRVLFTGNAWSSSTSPFNGVTSSELAENFLDYSLSDVSDEQMGFKTKLTDKLKLGAEMDQMPGPPGETNVYYSRKINGEMDLSDHMSLNVSRQVLPQDNPSYGDSQSDQPETQVYWEYKKRF